MESHGAIRGEKGLDPSKTFYSWWGDSKILNEKNDLLIYMSKHLSPQNIIDPIIIDALSDSLDLYYKKCSKWNISYALTSLIRKKDELKKCTMNSLTNKLSRKGMVVDVGQIREISILIEDYYSI